MTKSDRTRKLRRKPAALMSMQFCEVCEELYAIRDCCADIHWWMDTDEDVLLGALDGDEEDAWEFRMAFTDLECKTEALLECLSGWEAPTEAVWDDCTVGLLGRRYQVVGFDDVEEDYVALSSCGAQYATEEAVQRLTRMTKKELLGTVGQCVGILLAYWDLRQQYDYLSATLDILRDQDHAILDRIKEIERIYDEDITDPRLTQLFRELPQELWVV